jgi:guanylate kinase
MVREEKFLWHVSVHRYQFGTTKTAIEQAISGGLFIAVLTIEAVEILHAYVAHRAKQSSVRSVYLDLTDEEELLRRLAGRKDTRDMQERIAECKDWGKKARAAAAPLRIIDARASREKILAETLTYFK